MDKIDLEIIRSQYTKKKINKLSIPKDLIEFLGNPSEAIVLSQILYWGDKIKNNKGWVYKTYQDFSDELGLTVNQIRTAKKNLEHKGLLETELIKVLGKPTVHYKISDSFINTWNEFCSVKYHNHDCDISQMGLQNFTNGVVKFHNPYNNTKTTYRINKDINSKTTNKIKEISKIFKKWNDGKIVIHVRLTEKIKSYISEVLDTVSFDEFIQSIANYSEVVNSDNYYFKTRWSLIRFIETGLRDNSGFTLFLPDSRPLERFKINKDTHGLLAEIKKEFKPITSSYNENKIADLKKRKYYGFNLDIIENPWSRILITELDINQKPEWKFSHFWQLELCLASFIFHRKKEDLDMNQVELFYNHWKKLKPTFEQQQEAVV